jgi:hypothetical protein
MPDVLRGERIGFIDVSRPGRNQLTPAKHGLKQL